MKITVVKSEDGKYTSNYGKSVVTTLNMGYIMAYLAGIMDALGIEFKQDITISKAVELINAKG